MCRRRPRAKFQRVSHREPPVAVGDRSWWAGGLTLHERLTAPGPAPRDHAESARLRLEQWRSAHGAPDRDWLGRRLAETGLDEAALTGLLGEAPEELAARVHRPDWADYVATALRWRVRASEAAENWVEVLAGALWPLVRAACRQLGEGPLTEEFGKRLGARLVRVAARTLVLELNRARARGDLTGQTPTERFADFARGLDLPGLLTTYPVLARLLAQSCQHAVAAHRELLERLDADRAVVVRELLDGTDPGELVSVLADSGDAHRRGRSVAVLVFADGRRVVYKPRPLDLHEHFGQLLDWLNGKVPELGLRGVRLVTRQGYGWLEFVESRPCGSVAEVSRFYHRQGALVALLYALDGTDTHYENLIACGDQPVLVDVETLFHPTLPPVSASGEDPAAAALLRSVQRTCLLPQVLLGDNGALDVSGLGGDRDAHLPVDSADWAAAGTDTMHLVRRTLRSAGALNRPRLGELEPEPGDYQSVLLNGFRAVYDGIVAHREELSELLAGFAEDEVRYVARPSQLYGTLLDESTHPDVLRDALDRDRVFDLLWTDSLRDPLHWRLVPHEIADLWAGDVPLFTCRPGSRDLWAADGSPVGQALPVSGLSSVRAKLSRMGEVDRHAQEWLIAAAFATRPGPVPHRSAEALPGHLTAEVPDPQRLLAAACGIADELLARAHPGQDRVNWLGLELVDERQWLVLPMGAGLANGYTGVALFLAQLAELTGAPRYVDLAVDALRPLPALLSSLAANRELGAAVGSGGFHGLGGICYALARLSGLLAGANLTDTLRLALDLATDLERTTGSDEPADVAEGLAGGLAAMLAVHRETGLAQAGDLAIRYADRLTSGVHRTSTGAGFARGPAGVGWALRRLAATIGSERHERAANEFGHGTDIEGQGWCTGLAGLVLAEREPQQVSLLAEQPPLRDLSLCHGELGVLDALAALASRGDQAAEAARNRRAGLLLGSLSQYGPRCGTPDGVPTPGLLSGLAGIGYGLLRLGFAHVPSVLQLDTTNSTRSQLG